MRPRPPRFCARKVSSVVRLMKPSRVMVTTIWPGSIRLSSSWSASASTISVIRGEAISLRAAGSSSVITSMRRVREPRMSSSSRIFSADLGHLGLDLLALQAGQALQAQFQDAARLFLGQAHRAVRRDDVAGLVDQRQQRADIARPASRAPSAPSRAAAASGLARISADHLVDVGDRDRQADQVVRPVARLAEFEARAAEDHLLAEADEGTAAPRCSPICRGWPSSSASMLMPKRGLQLGEAEQLVQHHLGRRVALQLDDDAHAGAVALVAHLADALDLLGAHQFGDLLDQGRLVHLIRDFGDDDRRAVLADFLELGRARG